jgi:hypothetical protein
MKPIVVSGVTPQQYQAFLAKLSPSSQVLVETTPAGGKLSYQGTVVGWTYANNTVTATPLSKPFFVTEGHIDEWINEALIPYVEKPAVPAGPAPTGGPAPTAAVKAFNPNPAAPAALDWKAALGLKVK